ncbi:MAG: glycosyltransferase family 2 protein [Pirellulaceae bacterium]|nr:glycosyltransferase family 2 protein [Pirellulaceae bacterium]
MTSAPRTFRTVERSLLDLRRAGFSQPIHLFEEPGAAAKLLPGVFRHRNRRQLGMWPNWARAARFLLAETTARWLLICEDDLFASPAAARTLAKGLAKHDGPDFGLASLYTSDHNARLHGETRPGWQPMLLGRNNWGSLAYCFSRESLAAILATSPVKNHDSPVGTDSLLGAACIAAGRRMLFHLPSLFAHAGGGISTMGTPDKAGFSAVGFAAGPRSKLPLVSALMPTARRPEMAARAIRYFQQQDYANRELVIVDDGPDNLARFVARDSSIRYLRVEKPTSIGAKRNLAASIARGELLIQWDDDEWHGPARIRRQVRPLLDGMADITGLGNPVFFELADWRFWRYGLAAFDRLFPAKVHCGTLAYRRAVWEAAPYPDVSGPEDVLFLRQALSRQARLTAVPARSDFLHIRHGGNIWRGVPEYAANGGREVAPPLWTAADERFYRTLRKRLATGSRPTGRARSR